MNSLDKENKYKVIFTAIESCIFVVFLMFSIFSIIDFIFYDKYRIFDFFNTLSFRIAIVAFILFILMPQITPYLITLSEKVIEKYKQSRFRSEFISATKGKSEINIMELSQQYDLSTIRLKKELKNFIAEGMIKGELKEEVFIIDEKFGVMDVHERRMKFMKENLKKFLSAYSIISLNDISKRFKVPKVIVKEFIEKSIANDDIKAFIEGENLIRELSVLKYNKKNVFQCPHCEGECLIGSKFCSSCGKEL